MTITNLQHGHNRAGKETKIHRIWHGMLDRCRNENCKDYPRYGGRGIKVCERWLVFANFLEDMGEAPDGMSLERKANDGNYELSNCCWATAKQQAANRRKMGSTVYNEHARNLFLQRLYGITSAEYEQILRNQGGVCAICGRPPKIDGNRLHVDHDHKIEKTRITVIRVFDGFKAFACIKNDVLTCENISKKNAKAYVKKMLKKASVRGIVCWHCNTGLQKYSDSPQVLRKAALYLEKFASRSLSDKPNPGEVHEESIRIPSSADSVDLCASN